MRSAIATRPAQHRCHAINDLNPRPDRLPGHGRHHERPAVASSVTMSDSNYWKHASRDKAGIDTGKSNLAR
jgi:hypothetical protein